MDYKDKLSKIYNFLQSYRAVWNEEIIHRYPHALAAYPSEWIEAGKTLSEHELWQLDCGNLEQITTPSFKSSSLYALLANITQLIPAEHLKSNTPSYPLAKSKLIKIKNKKKHEIENILGLLAQLRKKISYTSVIDLGGGVGNLSRFIADECDLPCCSIDINEEFQGLGSSRLQKYFPHLTNKIDFQNLDFLRAAPLPLTTDHLVVGLHTCGALANRSFEIAKKLGSAGMVNFACCYSKLNPQKELNLSAFCRQNYFLDFSLEALNLASRSHAPIDYQSFLLKKRVKFFRYTLHFILYHHLHQANFMAVGEERPASYQKDFASYALSKLTDIQMKAELERSALSDNLALNAYFSSLNNQQLLRELFIANIIRWRFGRLIELAILLDRVIFLEESGFACEMREYFDSTISPRNIGITAIPIL